LLEAAAVWHHAGTFSELFVDYVFLGGEIGRGPSHEETLEALGRPCHHLLRALGGDAVGAFVVP